MVEETDVVSAAELEVVWLVLEITAVEDTLASELDDAITAEVADEVASTVDALLLFTEVVESAEDEEITSADVALVATELSLEVVAARSLLAAEVWTVALALVITSELVAADCATEVADTS